MQNAPNEVRFYNILMAFQHFAGKPLRATDAAKMLTLQELDCMEAGLRRLANYYRNEPRDQFPELHKLAEQIEKSLDASY